MQKPKQGRAAVALSSSSDSLTIGIDLGDRKSTLCVLDAAGQIVTEEAIMTGTGSFSDYFRRFPPSVIVIEVGMHSRWANRVLAECGHQVIVANPCKIKLIYGSDNKNDRVDARSLAQLARVDRKLLFPVTHRGEDAQAALSLLRARDSAVRARTRLINTVRGLIKPTGIRLHVPSNAEVFPIRACEQIPERLRLATALLLEQIESLSDTISVYDQYVEHLVNTEFTHAKLLQQVPGVGALTALAFVLTLDRPDRFETSRKVGAYLGLRPRQDQSGERNPQLGINKGGDEFLRRLLIQSSHYILGAFGPDCELRRWGLAIAGRGGRRAKKRAVAAVARKLAVLLHRLWVSGDVYEPWHTRRPEAA
jgi:transposase